MIRPASAEASKSCGRNQGARPASQAISCGMTALCSYPRCSNAAALTTDGLSLQYCDVHVPPASFEEYGPRLRLKDAVLHNPQDAGMQLQRVRELPAFIVAIEQTRQRLEERQVVLVLPMVQEIRVIFVNIGAITSTNKSPSFLRWCFCTLPG